MTVADLKQLLEVGAHFGHQSRRWNPKMEEYLFDNKADISVFDLTITKEHLDKALAELSKASSEGKTIIFVGTKRQAKKLVKKYAKEADCMYVTERWLGGTITNYDQINKSIKKLDEMKDTKEKGGFSKYTKKERLLLDREITRLEKFFGGTSELKRIPDYLVIIDVKREAGAVKEANMKGVKVVGVVDSNSDPVDVDFVIPMNDDATAAIDYVLSLLSQAIIEGKNKVKKTKPAKKEKK